MEIEGGKGGLFVESVPLDSTAGAFAPLAEEPWAFFLDSALNSPLGRFSFFGVRPFLTFTSKGSRIEIQSFTAGTKPQTHIVSGDPFEILRQLMERYSSRPPHPTSRDFQSSSLPFVGGAVGYWGYDLCHFLERLPRRAEDDLHLPDCALGFYDVVVAFDHLEGEAFIISSGLPELEPRTAEKRARARTEELLGLLHNTRSKTESRQEIDTRPTLARKAGAKARNYSDFASNFTLTEYLSAVQKAKQYIAAGDIYQVNLSQRFEVPITTGSFSVYDRLRQVSPAPFAAFLNFPEVAVASASPERFLRVTGRRIQTCPIKGTRPRGKEVSEDEQLAWDLQHSPKDLAENTMIVDLERNDLGKVCRYGSVEVMKFASLEAYSNVFHLVSTVEGELRPEVGHIDCLSACFPGGSITGAPKIRAMEIIDELEPTCRSAYTGAIGYLGWDGNMDLNIVIRTLLMARGKGWFQVGGGIVADSDPEAEYQETLDKAAGLFAALVEPSQLRAKSCHSPTQITERAALAAGVGRS